MGTTTEIQLLEPISKLVVQLHFLKDLTLTMIFQLRKFGDTISSECSWVVLMMLLLKQKSLRTSPQLQPKKVITSKSDASTVMDQTSTLPIQSSLLPQDWPLLLMPCCELDDKMCHS